MPILSIYHPPSGSVSGLPAHTREGLWRILARRGAQSCKEKKGKGRLLRTARKKEEELKEE